MKQNKNNHKWFLVGLACILIAAPNATIIKYTTQFIEPTAFNALRFGMIALVTTPYLVYFWKKLRTKALSYSFLASICMTIAVVAYVSAIHHSQASYASILTLASPIIFILYNIKMEKQAINRRSFAGITLAAAGAFAVVALPLLVHQGTASYVFYPFATLLIAINVVVFPLAIIFSKRAHEAGAPIVSTISITAWMIAGVSVLLLVLFQDLASFVVTPVSFWAAVYSGLGVALGSRILHIASYEKIGAVTTSALTYAEVLIALTIPVLALGEQLSHEMVLGGILILLGVYLVEYHKTPHHKHVHLARHH